MHCSCRRSADSDGSTTESSVTLHPEPGASVLVQTSKFRHVTGQTCARIGQSAAVGTQTQRTCARLSIACLCCMLAHLHRSLCTDLWSPAIAANRSEGSDVHTQATHHLEEVTVGGVFTPRRNSNLGQRRFFKLHQSVLLELPSVPLVQLLQLGPEQP
jgi:hypothetical protein